MQFPQTPAENSITNYAYATEYCLWLCMSWSEVEMGYICDVIGQSFVVSLELQNLRIL